MWPLATYASQPEVAIERAVLHRFGKMFRLEIFRSLKIRDRAGDFENPNNSLRNWRGWIPRIRLPNTASFRSWTSRVDPRLPLFVSILSAIGISAISVNFQIKKGRHRPFSPGANSNHIVVSHITSVLPNTNRGMSRNSPKDRQIREPLKFGAGFPIHRISIAIDLRAGGPGTSRRDR